MTGPTVAMMTPPKLVTIPAMRRMPALPSVLPVEPDTPDWLRAPSAFVCEKDATVITNPITKRAIPNDTKMSRAFDAPLVLVPGFRCAAMI